MLENRQSACGCDPYIAGAVGKQAVDMVAAPVTILALVKDAYLVAIEAVKAMLGTHPDISNAVLRGGIAASLRKTLAQRAMLEPDRLVLGEAISAGPQNQQNHKA